MELLFDKQIEIKTSIPSEINGVKTTMKELIEFVKDKHLKERPELFVDGDTV
jgi:ubiquitin related modifier 1